MKKFINKKSIIAFIVIVLGALGLNVAVAGDPLPPVGEIGPAVSTFIEQASSTATTTTK